MVFSRPKEAEKYKTVPYDCADLVDQARGHVCFILLSTPILIHCFINVFPTSIIATNLIHCKGYLRWTHFYTLERNKNRICTKTELYRVVPAFFKYFHEQSILKINPTYLSSCPIILSPMKLISFVCSHLST